jgi:hypothetical protein
LASLSPLMEVVGELIVKNLKVLVLQVEVGERQ